MMLMCGALTVCQVVFEPLEYLVKASLPGQFFFSLSLSRFFYFHCNFPHEFYECLFFACFKNDCLNLVTLRNGDDRCAKQFFQFKILFRRFSSERYFHHYFHLSTEIEIDHSKNIQLSKFRIIFFLLPPF